MATSGGGWTFYGHVALGLESLIHYGDVIMGTMASQITSITILYWTVLSGADQRKHQSSASLAFVRGIHRWPVNSPHKWPVTRKCFHLMTSSCCFSAVPLVVDGRFLTWSLIGWRLCYHPVRSHVRNLLLVDCCFKRIVLMTLNTGGPLDKSVT